MNQISIRDASVVYSCRRAAVVRHRRVTHDGFRDFSLRLQNFERALGEEGKDEYWQTFVRRLKRYRFEASAAPLPFGNRVLMPPELLRRLDDHLRQCRMLYPQYVETSGALMERLKRLGETNENPLLDRLDELGGELALETGELTVAIKESRLIPLFEDVLRTANSSFLRNIEIVSEAQLRGGTCYEELACIGPSRWFAEHVFSAPRAPRIHILHFNWIRDQWRPTSVFVGSAKARTASESNGYQREADEGVEDASGMSREEHAREHYLEVEELAPRLDLTQISQRIAVPPDAEQDDAEARLFQLEGRKGVFLDAEDGSKALVIDFEGEDEEEQQQGRVKRIATSAIEPGMYLLLRSGGGGDLIVPVADKILGGKAASRRKFQQLWKTKLRQAVRTEGAYNVCLRLKGHGSIRANEVNLRNWMSERNIRTEDQRDFAAIMQLVGLGTDAGRCWQIAGEIDSAHRQAGRRIRRLLLHQVLTANLRELEQRGRMEFELAESGGASVVAVRVVRLAPTVTRVLLHRLNHQFDLEEELWRE